MIDIKNLETFVWVATLRSFRAAAEKLNTTQPSVSQRVASLEGSLGVKLFERDRRSVALTSKGVELLDYAQRILDLRQGMLQSAQASRSIEGRIRIGVSETIVHTWLPKFMERVHTQHPAVSIELNVDTSPILREQVVSHQLNLAFLMGPIQHAGIENLRLCKYEQAWLSSPRLKLPQGVLTLHDLAEHPIITYPSTSQPYQHLRDLFVRADIPSPRLYGCGSMSVAVRMTIDAIGVAAITPIFLKREIDSGDLKLLHVSADPLTPLVFTASWARGADEHVAKTLANMALEVAAAHQ
jgi:DNA-binding transcriptional LysR family regulator